MERTTITMYILATPTPHMTATRKQDLKGAADLNKQTCLEYGCLTCLYILYIRISKCTWISGVFLFIAPHYGVCRFLGVTVLTARSFDLTWKLKGPKRACAI